MTPSAFTRKAERLGLTRRSVSLAAAQSLAAIETQPLPLLANSGGSVSPAEAGRMTGALVRHGFVALNREAGHYQITDQGREYLGQLRTHGLL